MKTKFDYSGVDKLLTNREVVIGLKSGSSFGGVVKYSDPDVMVLVIEPTSTLEIETKVVHTIIDRDEIAYVQFKTDRN